MQNIRQLLNRDNWLDYLRMAREGGLTDGAIANDIVAKIDKALRADNNHKTKPKSRIMENFNEMTADSKLRKEIEQAINKHSLENGSDTPDFILAEYLTDCLRMFDKAVNKREEWYGRKQRE